MRKVLTVLLDGQWFPVFCRNKICKDPITTVKKEKAIRGNKNSLEYFQRYYANHKFKIEVM